MATSLSNQSVSIPDCGDRVWLEYVFVPTEGEFIISKTYIVKDEPQTVQDCPVKSSNEYENEKRERPCPELALRPVAMYRDPFRQGKHKIVLCDVGHFDDKEFAFERRQKCQKVLDRVADEEPWFGFEQTYFFVDEDNVPCDWEQVIRQPNLETTNEYFWGKHTGLHRHLAELHVRACLYAGLEMFGMNREFSPSQWEYQLGPVAGISAADQLIVSRFIIIKLAEMHGFIVSFSNLDCMKGTVARSALHVNFSTKRMRDEGGIKHIEEAIENMSQYSQEDILKFYDLVPGNNYKWRLDGCPDIPIYDQFICKVGYKGDSSVRIPLQVAMAKKGYFEERRPSGEADPYDVCRVLTAAALLKDYTF